MISAGRAAFAAVVVIGAMTGAQAQELAVKIGVLSDMSSVFSEVGGAGSVAAAQLAVEDFNPAAHGMKVSIVEADHHNRPEVGASIARQWFDVDHVDAIADVPNSAVALAVSDLTREMNKVLLISGASSAEITGLKCSPNTVDWTYDTWMLANAIGKTLVKNGGDSWFFLSSDYAFAHALQRTTAAVVLANGGSVLGHVSYSVKSGNLNPLLTEAQNSKAKVIGLTSVGDDTIYAIKQGAEFGITSGGRRLASVLTFINEVQTLGLKTARGLFLAETWYWDTNNASRAFTKRWQAAKPGKFPSMVPAGVYASVTHYLKAVDALKSAADGAAVVAKMKEMPTDDPLFGKGTIRADGRKLHDAYLFEVKKPSESKYPGDDYKLRATIPAAEAFRPLRDGGCPLVKG